MITLTFTNTDLNKSLEVGDLIYYVDNVVSNLDNSGFVSGDGNANSVNPGVSTMIWMGAVAGFEVDNNPSQSPFEQDTTENTLTIYVDTTVTGENPTAPSSNGGGDFIFFAKNNVVHQSSILGYYNSVTLSNDSKEKAELFAVTCEVTESSK